MNKIFGIFPPPRKMQPEEIDLHGIDYDFPVVRNSTPTPKSCLNQERPQPQLLASSLESVSKSHSAGFPHTSNPSYASANLVSACTDTIENEKSEQARETTEQLASKKMSNVEPQAKKMKAQIFRSEGIRKTDIPPPVRQGQPDTMRALIESASRIGIYCDPTSQSKTITLSDQERAKAQLPKFYGRNQFASDAAKGNIKLVERFLAAHPETDVGPSEYSPSPLQEAAKNGHLDVVEALLPKASEQIRIDTLCSVCSVAMDKEQQTKLEPIVKALAQSVKTKNKNDVFKVATNGLTAVPGNSHYQWVMNTLTDAWHAPEHTEKQ